MSQPQPALGSDWHRALALFLAAFALSVVRPAVLVGVPLVLLLLIFPAPRLAGLIAAVLVALFAFAGAPRGGLWYLERGWAILVGGGFVAATLRWPAAGVLARAAAAVVGALLVAAFVLLTRPGSWEVLDWMVADRMRSAVAGGLEALRVLALNGSDPSQAVVNAVTRAVELQAQVFPALVALSSLAALAVAWWLYLRLGHGRSGSLGAVRDFSFNDHLVWVLIAGIALLVVGWGEAWGRAGSNAVVFMGALYALRGVAVVLFLTGGVSLLGGALLALSFLLVAPVVLSVALCIGVGDTWLSVRQRLRSTQ